MGSERQGELNRETEGQTTELNRKACLNADAVG